ncbi:MAG: OsmC family protein [Desulfuromonadaceae bacterium]|nr:OsmC family protein [Desulfuromonadaceae bacterium]
MEISFPGGVAVHAACDGFSVATDQPLASGGTNAAPSPFALFLASLGTCAGFFALRFCQQRDIDTSGMKLTLETEKGTTRKIDRVKISIHLPENFPEKYRKAIIKATDACAVKQAILAPPEFIVEAVH